MRWWRFDRPLKGDHTVRTNDGYQWNSLLSITNKTESHLSPWWRQHGQGHGLGNYSETSI